MSPRVLVTGSSGWLGRALARALARDGEEVRTATQPYTVLPAASLASLLRRRAQLQIGNRWLDIRHRHRRHHGGHD